jgi:hypothetical protein
VRDAQGRLFCEVTVPRLGDEHAGQRWKILGNTFESGDSRRIGFLEEKTGRPAEPEERQPRPEGRPSQSRRQKWPDDYPARDRELHAQGLSCPAVAEQLDVPFGTINLSLRPAVVRPDPGRSHRLKPGLLCLGVVLADELR